MKPREAHEPKLSGVLIAAWVNCVVGVVLGFLFMASFPAMVFPSIAELSRYQQSDAVRPETKPGSRYFVKVSPNGGTSWQQKRKQLIEGSIRTVSLESAEINAWLSELFRAASPQAGQGRISVVPGIPNVSTGADRSIYLSLPLKMKFFEQRYERTFFLKAHFENADSVRLVIDEAYVGCAAIPVVGGYLLGSKQFVAALRGSEELTLLAQAWDRVESIVVSDSRLNLSFR